MILVLFGVPETWLPVVWIGASLGGIGFGGTFGGTSAPASSPASTPPPWAPSSRQSSYGAMQRHSLPQHDRLLDQRPSRRRL
ncbi:hypothetical protein G9E11_15380 [Arthrobacter sp. IA7]|uniref:hypothetical protein n=1 Tax=Arthrobacter ipis TaxID=2716202 RepID=UPI0016889DEC|nr:hypothetical protein [Arthrobacter ipis]MBD1543593.1 hypothetical protein [Arthrobacter ipis]